MCREVICPVDGCSFGRTSDLQPAVLYFNTAAHCPRGAPNPKVDSVSDTQYRRKTSALHAQPTRAASAQVSPPLPLAEQRSVVTEPLRSAAFRPPSLTPACLRRLDVTPSAIAAHGTGPIGWHGAVVQRISRSL
jgi:hypothetical protein